jgi:hypothetical protein
MALTHAISLREARAQYFRENGLEPDGGYSRRWVKLQVGTIPMWFPNTDARRRAVWLHDLHHIVTGYDTSWIGEAEIAAWELGGGCGDYYAAWLLNAAAAIIGLLITPHRVWRAFIRGKHSCNLYNLNVDEHCLDETVDTMRKRLGIADA